MIILNIFAFLSLIPLTFILIIIFNIYSFNLLYLVTVTVYLGVYSLIGGLVFSSLHVAMIIFIFLAALYIIRMLLLARQSNAVSSKRVALYGKLTHKHLSIIAFMQLGFLNLLKFLPNSVNTKLSNTVGFKISITDLLTAFFEHSKGTKIEINNDETNIYLEIK